MGNVDNDLKRDQWLASLRTEYDVICRYRLEWARTAQNYGWIIIPVSVTLPALLFGYTIGQSFDRFAVLAGMWISVGLLLFWRIFSHSVDRQVRLLYVRAIEIEEILGIHITRIWLKQMWHLDRLPTVADAEARAAMGFDWSRGHLILDCYFYVYSVATLIISLIAISGSIF